MLHVLKTRTESEPSNDALPENANLPMAGALTTYGLDTVYPMSVESGLTVLYLRAGLSGSDVALWLQHDGSENVFGASDTLEITGPPTTATVELRIRDFSAGGISYEVSATNDAGSITGPWERYKEGDESGVHCELTVPSGEANSIKFTVSAHPSSGSPPNPLDPIVIIKKEG